MSKPGAPAGVYKPTSVRSRILDLLATFEGEWLSLDTLEVEYSERFGTIKRETLRRSLYRAIEGQSDGSCFVRRVPRPYPQQKRLEVLFTCEEAGDDD